MRRSWEKEPHPFVFFNADNSTFTFLGVKVEKGNLLDAKRSILALNAMADNLYRVITNQCSSFREKNILNESFDSLTLEEKRTKLCRVLGISDFTRSKLDFDDSYELTQDNVLKLLAIHMRFQCDIPVIVMGETGCGKTRLVEFLCHLMAAGDKEVEN